MTNFFGWQQIPSPLITEILCFNHYGIVLDTEHSFWNYETIQNCIQVGKLSNSKVYVRIHKKDTGIISKILDAGADGIILSTVETLEEAVNFKSLSLHPLQSGKRGLGLVRQNMWGQEGLESPMPSLIPQIETKTGIDNLQSIKDLGFDFYLIGPYDLSSSLGSPGSFDDKKFLDSIERFKSLIPEEKRAVHVPNDVADQIYKYSSFGMICLGMDTISLVDTSRNNVNVAQRNINIRTDKSSLPESSQ